MDGNWDQMSKLQILWMTRPSALESLLDIVQCKCRTGCKTQRCSCLHSGLKCTAVCSCSECQNNLHVIDGEDESDPSDNDDEDDYDLGNDDNMFDDLSE